MKVGFIGLGQMGSHMAHNLVSKQLGRIEKVLVYDTVAASTQRFQKRLTDAKVAIKICDNPRQVGEQADMLVTMLPSSPHVQQVYLNDQDGILAGLTTNKQRSGIICIDSSTIDPTTSVNVSRRVLESGNIAVDAPVSGGVGGAEAGTLTFMVGAESNEHFDLVKPHLQLMGKNIVKCGSIGTGQAAKICNNMLLGISMLAASETMNLGIRLGIDPKVLSDIIATSSGRCWSIDTYNPVPGIMPNVPASKGYNGGFAVELMTKDLQLASKAASDTKSFNILGSLTKGIYEAVCQAAVENSEQKLEKLSGKDFSVVFRWMNDNAKKYQ